MLLFGIAYLIMLFADSETLKYLPIIIVFISVIFFGSEITFACFTCFMFFSYPQINAVALLFIAISIMLKNRKLTVCDKKTTAIMVIFTVWVFIDLLLPHTIESNWNEGITWAYVLIIVLVCQNISSYSSYFVLVGLQLAGLLLVLLQIGCMVSPHLSSLISNMSAIRIPDINYRSIIYGSCVLITEYLIFKKMNGKVYGLICIVLSIFGILSLGTRGMMALLLVYFMMRYILMGEASGNGIAKKAFIAIAVFAACVYFIQTKIAEDIVANLQSISSTTMHSNYVRIRLYEDILTRMIPKNFVAGVGPGNFTFVYPQYATIPFMASHAHSIYLQILSEDGVIGFALILSMIMVFIGRAIKGLIDKTPTYQRTCAYINMFFLVYGAVEHVWGDSRALGLFIIINIMFITIQLKENDDDRFNVYNQ